MTQEVSSLSGKEGKPWKSELCPHMEEAAHSADIGEGHSTSPFTSC